MAIQSTLGLLFAEYI